MVLTNYLKTLVFLMICLIHNYTILMGNNGSGKSSLCRISHVILNRNAKFQLPPKKTIMSCQQKTILFESKSVLYNLLYVTPYIYSEDYKSFNDHFNNDIYRFQLTYNTRKTGV